MDNDWATPGRKSSLQWHRSISEPDLSDPFKQLERFIIKHPHEFISIDDLKFFRRKNPPDLHTKSSICLYDKNKPVLPFSFFKTEYEVNFQRPHLKFCRLNLRRATSLHLEGLMNIQSEHRSQYHPFTLADLQSSRSYPTKNPANLQVGGETMMTPEYRSSYISYPMVDRTMKILPREVFHVDHDDVEQRRTGSKNVKKHSNNVSPKEENFVKSKEINRFSPSEYRCKFIKFPIEKAYSIPQATHIKMQGDFNVVPEYRDKYKMYETYFKSASIKKPDNLKIGTGSEVNSEPPEYKDKFKEPPQNHLKQQSIKNEDHLHPHGEFTKERPEYFESFRDPQIKEMPERGKCREPYLRLKGKLEFNPEYKSTYLDFSRSRPVVKKSYSTFRLPQSTVVSKIPTKVRQKFRPSSPVRAEVFTEANESLPAACRPEYRRAHFNYQIRERTPTRKAADSVIGSLCNETQKGTKKESHEKSSCKREPSRRRQVSGVELASDGKSNLEDIRKSHLKMSPKFGRRGLAIKNAARCRNNTSIIEGNPKYTVAPKQESFVILDEPCKRNSWMKKSWYES